MVDIEYLKESVKNAKARVEKAKATVKRHEAAAENKLAGLKKLGIDTDGNLTEQFNASTVFETRAAILMYENKLDEIESAKRKVKTVEGVLDSWQDKLNKAVEKKRFLNNQAPQVIKDFLEAWKERAYEWHLRKYKKFPAFREKLKKEELEACIKFVEDHPGNEHLKDAKGKVNKDRRDWYTMHNSVREGRKELKKHLEELKLDYASIHMREAAFAGGLVLRMVEFRDEQAALKYLDKELESDKQAKMFDLIERVNAVVGSITDASGLQIDQRGNLNGIIIGKKGKADVNTIGAGGWNIQCFHYRTLVHEIKEKAAK